MLPQSSIQNSNSKLDQHTRTTVERPLVTKGFQVFVHGVVEGAECDEASSLFARTQLFFGPDWSFLSLPTTKDGSSNLNDSNVVYTTYSHNAEVITQLSDRSTGPFANFVWAAPFEFALHSTNPHGWPQLIVTLHTITSKPLNVVAHRAYGRDLDCRDAIVGYSRCFVPMQSGHHSRQLSIMQLENATKKHQLISFLTREAPVLRDVSYICRGDDRVVLTTRPVSGYVKLTFVVMIQGMSSCGFDDS
ncbi:unnamed protein product [Phytomonas sp. EM1]|nr:unnamed protein product [Phytomonas sp. EM1]|eukprot:CCW62697.1 unnamed protein product [Phytomonas sp. isolate EM1]